MKPWAHQNSSSLCRRSVLPRRLPTQATVPTHRCLRRSASQLSKRAARATPASPPQNKTLPPNSTAASSAARATCACRVGIYKSTKKSMAEYTTDADKAKRDRYLYVMALLVGQRGEADLGDKKVEGVYIPPHLLRTCLIKSC